MDMNAMFEMHPIGIVHSTLTDPATAPKQGDEESPQASLDIDPDYAPGLASLAVGDDLLVLTWLHLARRDVLSVHPRGNPDNPQRGVFNTRSPDRPNPIGLHRVQIVAIDGTRIRVRGLEAIDKTPIVDLKSVRGRSTNEASH
jgi:tRNA-Thr(GGU) m(6)t(6)A37 methyltransferase TsaA